MSWLSHPSFQRAQISALNFLRHEGGRLVRTKHIFFICGGQASPGRDFLKLILEKKLSDTSTVFYAEEVWEEQEPDEIDALEMETILADIADCLVLIVESPGTFAELGAFSATPKVKHKLLILMDKRYQHEKSFINLGPVSSYMRDKKCKFSPIIHTDLSVLSDCYEEFVGRLSSLPMPRADNQSALTENSKKLLYLTTELIALLGPLAQADIVSSIRDFDSALARKNIILIVGLAKSLGLVRTFRYKNKTYYYRSLNQPDPTHYDKKVNYQLSRIRLKVLSAIQRLPEGRALLSMMSIG